MAVKFEDYARNALVEMMIEAAEAKGWAVERVNDFASVAIEVVDGAEARWMVVKATAPKLFDKDGNEMWTIDDAMLAYNDRVKKEADKAAAKEEKAAESARKKAERAAKDGDAKVKVHLATSETE